MFEFRKFNITTFYKHLFGQNVYKISQHFINIYLDKMFVLSGITFYIGKL
jgi:hypothetical protein